jgi:hypothetical protein
MADRNFQRAHDQYLTPPDEPEGELCEGCKGEGVHNNFSSCCHAESVYMEEHDVHICTGCKKVCDPARCEECHGKGVVEPPDHAAEKGEHDADADREEGL